MSCKLCLGPPSAEGALETAFRVVGGSRLSEIGGAVLLLRVRSDGGWGTTKAVAGFFFSSAPGASFFLGSASGFGFFF